MTNQEVEQNLKSAIKNERVSTYKVIKWLTIIEDRKIYLERGHSSLFYFLVNHHGYDNPSANRRTDATYAALRAPSILEKLKEGCLNLTNISQAYFTIKAHEKRSKQLSPVEFENVFRKLEKQTSNGARQILSAMFPDNPKRESKRQVSENETRLFLTISKEGIEDLEWLKAHWSHIFPEGKFADVIARAAKETRARYEKTTKQEKPANETTGQKARKLAMQRAHHKCGFVDPVTGNKCGSTYQVQVDHIVPRALGGLDNLENMRCLCRRHNIHMAERELGKKWANHWRQ